MSFDINHHEYGLSEVPKTIDFQFHPSEYGVLDNYSVLKEIYKVQLSPTVISLATHKETNQVCVHSLSSKRLTNPSSFVVVNDIVDCDKEEYNKGQAG